jgi:hypothetical protein
MKVSSSLSDEISSRQYYLETFLQNHLDQKTWDIGQTDFIPIKANVSEKTLLVVLSLIAAL